MYNLNKHISEFLNSKPDNRVVFCNLAKDPIDFGKELSNQIKPHLGHKRLSMKTKDLIDELIQSNIKSCDEIGKHMLLKIWVFFLNQR